MLLSYYNLAAKVLKENKIIEAENEVAEEAKMDKIICKGILHFMRPDLVQFKELHVLRNPLSTDVQIRNAIAEITLAIKREVVTFKEV